jgi:hypothetical protein
VRRFVHEADRGIEIDAAAARDFTQRRRAVDVV